MNDIVQQLRDRAYSSKVPDALCEMAADAIERMRQYYQGGTAVNDIVTILRDISNENDIDADLAQACRDGAMEIARLRLTDAEREAVRFFSLIDGPGNVPVANKRAATLRGLLERLK
jgi:hypothetical protein